MYSIAEIEKQKPFYHLTVKLLLNYFGLVWMSVVEVFISRKMQLNKKKINALFHIFQSQIQWAGLDTLLDQFWPLSLMFDNPALD